MSATIVLTIVILTVVGLVLALILFWVANRFKVEEDPRIDEVEKTMPGANCGGCGFAGCRAFADAAVKAPGLDDMFCPVGGNEVMKKVASILGFEAKEKAPQVAVLRCNGSCEHRPRTNVYDGVYSCRVKAALYTGDTGCSYGCVGCGDCVASCDFGAMRMDPETGLPVIDDQKCTACGSCVKACPKFLLELRNKGPRSMRVYVACRNEDKGGVARKACSVACIGCSKCVKSCAHDAITVTNNLAYIDYAKCKLCRKCVDGCPTSAIHAVNFPPPRPAAAKPVSPAAAKAGTAAPVATAKPAAPRPDVNANV